MSDIRTPVQPLPPTVLTKETEALRLDGLFLCDSDGNKIAAFLDTTGLHEVHGRRLVACMKAMQGITTDTIESVVGSSDNNLIVELVNRHIRHDVMLRNMEESLRATNEAQGKFVTLLQNLRNSEAG